MKDFGGDFYKTRCNHTIVSQARFASVKEEKVGLGRPGKRAEKINECSSNALLS